MKIHQHIYVNGKWTEPNGGDRADVTNATTEDVIGRIPLGDASDADNAVRAARAAFDGWSRTSPQQRSEWLAKIAQGLEARAAEIAQLISAEVGTPIAWSQFAQTGAAVAHFGVAAQLLGTYDFTENRRQFRGVARAGRRGGVHHAVELSAHADRGQGRAGARRGLHRRVEALGSGAAHGLFARRSDRCSRPAAGRLQSRAGLWPGGRRGAGVASRSRHGVVHRIDGGGAARRRTGRADDQARRARTGRQVGRRHPRRRRFRERHPRRDPGVFPQQRTDLLRPHADARPASAHGRGEANRGAGGRRDAGRQSARRAQPDRPGHLGAAALARAGPHPPRTGRRRRTRDGRTGRARRAHARLLRPADRLRQCHLADDDRPRGNLRTGALDPRLRRRKRRRAHRERLDLRTFRRGLVGRCRARATRGAASAHGPGRHQRCAVQPARAVRRLQAVGQRTRVRHATASRNTSNTRLSRCRFRRPLNEPAMSRPQSKG